MPEGAKAGLVPAIRPFRVQDVDAVSGILSESPQAAAWSKAGFLELLNQSDTAAFVVCVNEEIAGFVTGRTVGDQAEVLNLAVGPAYRKCGYGSGLLVAAFLRFKSQGAESVFLEVRESNTPAIAFYRKHGFQETGRRKNYYREPAESALTMMRKLTGPQS